MTREIEKLYRRFRQPSIVQGATYYHVFQSPARYALANARIMAAFHEMEDETVRLRCEPDEFCSMDDLKGDIFDRKCNPDIQESLMARQEKEFEESIERLGVWGIIGEYLDPATGEWEHGGSCWGFTGYENPGDPFENIGAISIIEETMDALQKVEKQWEGAQQLARIIMANQNALTLAFRCMRGETS